MPEGASLRRHDAYWDMQGLWCGVHGFQERWKDSETVLFAAMCDGVATPATAT
jgi:hypothetical protein